MTTRGWKIALAASVALNVFGLAGGVAAWIAHDKALARSPVSPAPGDPPGFSQIMDGLEPATRERIRSVLRASAKAAKPDFQEGREARQKAIALAASPTGDVAEISRLLDQSRAAEMRGRERMERSTAPLFATLEPADRQTLSVLLRRRGVRRDTPIVAPPARPEAPAPAAATSAQTARP